MQGNTILDRIVSQQFLRYQSCRENAFCDASVILAGLLLSQWNRLS